MNDFLSPEYLRADESTILLCRRCCLSPANPSSQNGMCFACDASYYRKRKELSKRNPTAPTLTAAQFIQRFPPRKLTRRASDDGVGQELIPGFIFFNPVMRRMADAVRRVAGKNATVLIFGETGTGKELIAQAIHRLSPRSGKPLGIVDCTTLKHDLAESELFGHIRGAFTGATNTRTGIFPDADSGTVFLDELSMLPLDMQAKLLRILEQREYRPVGSTKYERIDIRLVGATNESLEELVKQGRFRKDLYHRLDVVQVRIPPLRERKEEITLLARHMLERFDSAGAWITPDALKILKKYEWPGNVRELRNVLEGALIMRERDDDPITPDHLPEKLFT